MVMWGSLFHSLFPQPPPHSHSSNLFHNFSPHTSFLTSEKFQFRQFEISYSLISSKKSFHFKPHILKLISTYLFPSSSSSSSCYEERKQVEGQGREAFNIDNNYEGILTNVKATTE